MAEILSSWRAFSVETHIIFFDSMIKNSSKKEMTCFNLPRALASFIVFKHSSYFLLTAPFNFVSNHDVNWVCQVLLLSKSVINACLFLANDLGHDTPKFTDSRGETSDFRPPLPTLLTKGFCKRGRQRGVWLTKDTKSEKKAMVIYF